MYTEPCCLCRDWRARASPVLLLENAAIAVGQKNSKKDFNI
jgi:hypothetical protein